MKTWTPARSACRWAWLTVLIAAMTGLWASPSRLKDATAAMQGPLAAQVREGCSPELARHCAEVTPGEGRLLACLYAHGDKLSGQCEFALYDAAARLERAINASPTSRASAARTSRCIVPMWKWVKPRRAVPEGSQQHLSPGACRRSPMSA